MSTARRAEQVLVRVNGAVIAGMLFVMFLLVFANVVTRYAFGFSLNWAEEASRFLMIWITYLGAGLAMREGQHAAITLLQNLLPDRIARWLRALVAFIMIAFMATLAFLGFQYSKMTMDQTTAGLRLPSGAVYLAVPLGAIGFVLHLIAGLRDYVKGPSTESSEPTEALVQREV
jgi:TRAP-type C4-dicarboxylate transport system permease small subunit